MVFGIKMSDSTGINSDTFTRGIHLDLYEWLEKLPPDFQNIMKHDGQFVKKDEFKELVDSLAEFGFDNNEIVKTILTDFGDIGRFRFLARLTKEMQFDCIVAIDMLSKISPDDNGIKGTLDRFKGVLAERMSQSLLGDTRFQKMMAISMPEFVPSTALAKPQKEMRAIT